jgi:hypothetical protein
LIPAFAVATARQALFNDRTITLGAEFSQHCGDLVSRVALGAGAKRSADLSLQVRDELEQIDGHEWG